jgi:hypothetical protein
VPLSTSSPACLLLSQNLILADAKTLFLMKVGCYGYRNKRRIVSIVCVCRTQTKYTSTHSLHLKGVCVQMFSSYVAVVPDSKSSISVTQRFSLPMPCSALWECCPVSSFLHYLGATASLPSPSCKSFQINFLTLSAFVVSIIVVVTK